MHLKKLCGVFYVCARSLIDEHECPTQSFSSCCIYREMITTIARISLNIFLSSNACTLQGHQNAHPLLGEITQIAWTGLSMCIECSITTYLLLLLSAERHAITPQ